MKVKTEMKTAFVTGGAGFLGSHLCERLLKDGYRVIALDDLYTGSRANLADFAANPRFTFVEADVRDIPALPVVRDTRFDEIYNLACPASPVHYQSRPRFTTETSIFGILACIDLAKRDGAKMLHTSTSEVYGDPAVHPQVESYWGNVNTIGIRSCYDEGKRVAETLAADSVRACDTDVRMVRIFNTYGPRMHPQDGRVISNFIMQALRDEDITVFGDGSQTRSFQYCDDLVEAFRRYMELDKSAVREFFGGKRMKLETEDGVREVVTPAVPVINTGNPGEYTIRQLAEITLEMLPESKSRIVTRPLPGDDPKKRKPDITLARALLGGWEPKVPLREGYAKTMEYFRSRKFVADGK